MVQEILSPAMNEERREVCFRSVQDGAHESAAIIGRPRPGPGVDGRTWGRVRVEVEIQPPVFARPREQRRIVSPRGGHPRAVLKPKEVHELKRKPALGWEEAVRRRGDDERTPAELGSETLAFVPAVAGGVMRTSVYVFDGLDLARSQPSGDTERVDVGAREHSRARQGIADHVVTNLVIFQDVALGEHGIPERVDVGLGDVVVETNSIAVDITEEYGAAPDLRHRDLDRVHEQVAGRDPVEVIREPLGLHRGFSSTSRASIPVREGWWATVVRMMNALGCDR